MLMLPSALTFRGRAVVGFVLAAIVLGVLFGTRTINAVLAPTLVALAIALLRDRSLEEPTIRRSVPREVPVDGRVTVTVDLEDSLDRLGRIVDHVPAPLRASGNVREIDLGSSLTYEIECPKRGEYTIGPVEIAVTDTFGLAERRFTVEDTQPLLVLPRVLPIATPGLEHLAGLAGIDLRRERHEFDRLREYHPGDSLRDVHWKTSAKRPDIDFVVKEFVVEADGGTIVLSGEAIGDGIDPVADVLASLATAFVNEGVSVDLETPDGSVEGIDRADRLAEGLRHLAAIDIGRAGRRGQIHVTADGDSLDDVIIEVGEEQVSFDDLQRIEAPARQRLLAGEVID